ncbi:hypothetical protein G7092_05595 [Mucilaginibacter sp. HC2]|uniref:hypothetical protein n=1 Tax=Mucilaginibacter inviolabilis TaxID=2714892 RepID=UPI00140AF446|nr:hypothetical protein [Mucilaginibacter inviolabilis]NHA03254.1 hypothetical protein [Mucilaginibacter inviolabilis]
MKKTDDYNGPLPVVELEGTSFYVNGYLMALVEVANPDNQITMYDLMCLDDHVELWYDPLTKNAFGGPLVGILPDRVKLFWLYPFDALDPLGKNAWMDEFRTGWREHYPSDLPVVQIAGKDFFIDEKRNTFRDTENYWNQIKFADVFKHNGKTGVYIDTTVLQVPFPHELDPYHPPAKLPEHIVFAEVPDGHHTAFLLHEYNKSHHTSNQASENGQDSGQSLNR